MNPLAPIAVRLGKLIPRLGSDHDGEVVATAYAIRRTLEAAGCTLHDLAAAVEHPPVVIVRVPQAYEPPPPPARPTWREMLRDCILAWDLLSDREKDFVDSMRKWRSPTPKQRQWLDKIYAFVKANRSRR